MIVKVLLSGLAVTLQSTTSETTARVIEFIRESSRTSWQEVLALKENELLKLNQSFDG